MPKKRVYVESSVISYLTARPASVAEKRVMQEQTRIWWEQRDRWELFISPSVVAEIRDGDREAARKRLAAVHGIPLLPEPADVKKLAAHLIAAGGIPEKAIDDAVHIAIATLNCMDYLVTWNQAHIFNPDTIGKLYSAIRESGYVPSHQCWFVRTVCWRCEMTFKRPFKFDFNEDADPVEELHRLRVAATRHFKTIDALLEYHRSVPSVEELIAELDKEIAENKAKAKAARALKPKAGKTVKVAKAGKAAAHAGRRKAAARLTTA